MDVRVIKAYEAASQTGASIVLQQNSWDDFGYKTQYRLYHFGEGYTGLIGNVKILQRGQVKTISSIIPAGPLQALGDDYCSLGQSLDYYEHLASLPSEARAFILNFFRDALADEAHALSFKDEKGWNTSVTRDLKLESYRPLARTLLERDYTALASLDVDMTFQVAGWKAPLRLDFSTRPAGDERDSKIAMAMARLPARVAVITGRNGSGKSTLMSRLARVLHASERDRCSPAISRLGTIEPQGIGFTRIVTVAYSAFDTFQVPGVDAEERRQIAKDLRAGTGRYAFAGLRDIARELEESLQSDGEAQDAGSDADDARSGALDERIALDRRATTYLKSVQDLAEEYARTLEAIEAANRQSLLRKTLEPLLADPSFADIPGQSAISLLNLAPLPTFMGWSTGLKIVMHAIVTLVARTERKSIVLIDEPESHLHPPLLAAFMHAVRIVLDENDAFAVIATHSPVVVQETLRRHVSVVNRVGDVVTILPPRIETYGESIGSITDDVFRMHPGATDYHATLRGLVEEGLTTDQIDRCFEGGMSLQARAYVMSLVASQAG